MAFEQDLFYREFIQREEEFLRAPYNPEMEFYSYIQAGDIDTVKKMCEEQPLIDKPGLGRLSKDKLKNLRYHFIITTALVARFCINGGMQYSEAYTISDMYIQKADLCTNTQQISDLHPIMCLDYARRMRTLIKHKTYSKHVMDCIEYIYNNLHTRIKVEELADHVGLNPTYLSKLFADEMGCSISYYITDKKIDTAKRMLVYSEYTTAQISSILAFSSQSYFTDVFKKKTGKTPSEYRRTTTGENINKQL